MENKVKKNINIILYLLLLICCIGQCINIGYLTLLASLVIVLITLFCNLEKTFEILFIALPFFNVLNMKIGQPSLYYVLVLIFLFKYFTYKKGFQLRKKLLLIVLIVLFTIGNLITLTSTYITWLFLLIPLILSYKEKFLENQFNNIVYNYALSMIISSLVGLYMQRNNLSIYTSSYVWNNGNILTRFSGLYGDSNVYSQSLLIIISLLVFNLFYYNKANRKITITFIIVLSLFGILTYSKMNILGLLFIFIITIIYLYFSNLKTKKGILKILVLTILLIALSLFGIKYIISHLDNEIISSYLIRFSAHDLLTGRMSVYSHFISILEENPLYWFLGMGFNNYITPFYISSTEMVKYAHNLYIECISLYGLPITIVIFMFICKKSLSSFKINHSVIMIMPIAVLIITGLTLHGNLEFSFFFNLILIIQCLNYKGGTYEKEQC